eukprot:CFRG2677T1
MMVVPLENSSDPVVLVIDNVNKRYSLDLISKITQQPTTTAAHNVIKWHIDNKYYEEDVEFRVCYSPSDISSSVLERVEGVLIFYHPDCPTTVTECWKNWEETLGKVLPELSLCIGTHRNAATDVVLSERAYSEDVNVVKWCVENGFEHIFVQESDVLRSDAGQAHLTTEDMSGVDRVVEALHCTMWSTMHMKYDTTRDTVYNELSAHIDSTVADTADDITACLRDLEIDDSADFEDFPQTSENDVDLAAFLTPDEMKFMEGGFFGEPSEESADDLEKSFLLMNSLKEKMNDLPMEQKHEVAEKVAMAFYRAMGGNDSESEELELDD